METPKKKRRIRSHNTTTSLRLWFILVPLFAVLFITVVYRLFQLQIVDGEKYKGLALQQRTSQSTLTAQRGSIYDRNNKVLAQSNTVWDVCISPAELNRELLPQVAEDLAEILDITSEEILKAAETRTASGDYSYYARIKRRVESGKRDEVTAYLNSHEEKIRGVYFEEATKRYYIYDNLASTVLGFTGDDNQGAYGLESYYNRILAGTPGVEVTTKDAWGADMPYESGHFYEAKDGHSLVLTLDETIQAIVEKNLEIANIEHNATNKSTGIVMNIKTGEVLAMSTKPDFNPNDPRTIYDPLDIQELEELAEEKGEDSEEYRERENALMFQQWRNKAISDPYEPGSVYKIITAAIALENNLTYVDEPFYCPGYFEISGERINCWLGTGHGQQTLLDAMRNSCNPVFLELGIRIGAELTQETLTNFGFGKVTGIDLPGEAEGILHPYSVLSRPGRIELANTSFGQSFKTTPIQLATGIGAALNGGYLMEPFVVKQIIDSQGNVVDTTEPMVRRQVISEKTSKTIQRLVEEVVVDGSGRHAAVPGYRIGGKTGTSEKLDLKPERKEYVLSFAGFAPMDDPTYLVLVLIDEPHINDPLSSVIAAPVVGAIMQEMLPYLSLEPQYTEMNLSSEDEVTVPYLIGHKPHDAQVALTAEGLRTNLVGAGGSVLKQIPLAGQKVKRGTVLTLYTEEDSIEQDIVVPSYLGLTPAEVQKSLDKLGLNVEYRGVTNSDVETVVGEQWPLPDSLCDTGDVVIITLVHAPSEEQESLPQITLPDSFAADNAEDTDDAEGDSSIEFPEKIIEDTGEAPEE